MRSKTAITVHRPLDEVKPRWELRAQQGAIREANAGVTFEEAPGDRGTEIHVSLEEGGVLKRMTSGDTLAKVKDELRRFKQQLETGEIPRSDAVPEGERAERKFKQRPAQPLEQSELEKAGVS
jgi:uncharacterized membrane protein